MRRTKIVATIGPASSSPATLRKMIDAGMDVARIGLAHGDLESHLVTYGAIREAAEASGRSVGILADLPGPKIRCSPFGDVPALLVSGATVALVGPGGQSSETEIGIDHEGVLEHLVVGDNVALGDGGITLQVTGLSADAVETRIVHGGVVQGRPGIHVPSDRIALSTPTDEDFRLADAFIEAGVDMLAISFVRSGHDVRRLGTEPAPRGPLVIAKIETRAAIDQLDSIMAVSDAIMVARGDLGVECSLAELPHLQKQIIRSCVAYGRPVITATQMLESMVAAPVPTRAESSDVANAVFDGSSSVMLSGETAIGIDPVNAVDTMAEIAQQADEEFDSENWLRRVGELRQDLGRADKALVTTDAITMAAARMAHQVEAKAILCLSRTGFTARAISRFRQDTPILCFSPEARTVHQLSLSWGVDSIAVTNHERPSEMIDEALQIAAQRRELSSGDTVVVVSGQTTRTRATDSLRVVEIP